MSQARSSDAAITVHCITSITLKACLVLIPLILLSLCSVFRNEIIGIFPGADQWHGVAAYSCLRLTLFLCFLATMYYLFLGEVDSSSTWTGIAVPSPSHDPLLGLRSLAFLMVLFGHWFGTVFPPEGLGQLVRNHSPIWLLTASPWCGVWIFFTLSGYLMGKGFVFGRYDGTLQGFKRFYKNRALRIVPMYYAAVLIVGVLVSPTMFDLSNPSKAADFISIFTFDNPGLAPIGALWSISTEVQFYLMVPFLFFALRRILSSCKGFIAFTVLITLTSFFYKYFMLKQFGWDGWHQFVYVPLLANFDVFLIGLAAAFAAHAIEKKGVKINKGVAIGITITILVWMILSYWSASSMLKTASAQRVFQSFAPMVTALLTASIILIFEASKRGTDAAGKLGRALWKISTGTGILTYALYVVHEPILLAARRMIAGPVSLAESATYFFFTLPIIWGVSYVLYRLVEVPFDKMKHSVKPTAR